MSALLSTNTSVVLLDFTSASSPLVTLPSTATQHGRLLTFKNISSNLSTQLCEIRTNGQDLFETNLSSFLFSNSSAHINFVANSTIQRWLYLGGIEATAARIPVLTVSTFLNPSTLDFLVPSFTNLTGSTSVSTLTATSSLSTYLTRTQDLTVFSTIQNSIWETNFLQPSTINQNHTQYPSHFSGRPTFSPSSISTLSLWLDGAAVLSTPSTLTNNVPIHYWWDKSAYTTEVSTIGDPHPSYTYAPVFNQYLPYFSTSPMFAKFPANYTGTGITSFSVWTLPDLSFHENPTIYSLTRPGLWEYTDDQTFYGTVVISTVITAQRKDILKQYDTYGLEEVNTPFLTATLFDDTKSWFNVNGISSLTASTACNTTMNVNITCVGGTTGISYENHHGWIAEVLVYFSSLSYSNIQKIEGYLAWKWGLQRKLPLTHPWYSIAP